MIGPAEEAARLVGELRERIGDYHGWKREAARRVGCHESYIPRLLRGEANPSRRTLEALRRAASGDVGHGASDPEIEALATIGDVMRGLDPEARARVVEYLNRRWR